MRNQTETKDLIKERSDIVSIVEKYVKLKPAGKNFTGLCPFHNEKTPSFNVSPQLQIFKCFGCGKTGDVFTFLQEIEHIDFTQALEKLAKEAGITLEKDTRSLSPTILINKWAKLYFQKELYNPRNKFALDYLHNRGINDELIKKFEIGYAPGDNQFYQRLKRYKNFSDKTLIDSGVFVEKNNAIREKFRKRVIFPINNLGGYTVAFTGRILPGNDYGPKYLHTAETPEFHKRNLLYGLNIAKASIRKEDLCILLESTTNVIALYKIGIQNSVASLGTGLTTEQLQLIKNYTNNILFVFDNDTAGQKALERAFLLASPLGINTFATNTSAYKDVDEMTQKDPEGMKVNIENRKDAFTYLIASKLEKTDTEKLSSLNAFEHYANNLLSPVSNETAKAFYKAKIDEILGKEVVFTSKKEVTEDSKKKESKANTLEELFLKSIISNEPIKLTEDINIEIFEDDLVKQLLMKIGDSSHTLSTLYESLSDNKGLLDKLENIALLEIPVGEQDKIYNRIYNNYLKKRLKTIRLLLAAAEEKDETEKIEKLSQEVLEISNKLRSTN